MNLKRRICRNALRLVAFAILLTLFGCKSGTDRLTETIRSVTSPTPEEIDVSGVVKVLPIINIVSADNKALFDYAPDSEWYLLAVDNTDALNHAFYNVSDKTVIYHETASEDLQTIGESSFTPIACIDMANGKPIKRFGKGNEQTFPILWFVCKDESGGTFVYKSAFTAKKEFISDTDFENGITRFFKYVKDEPIYGGILWK